jgi:hypothetical protein
MTPEDKQVVANYMGWFSHPKATQLDDFVYFANGRHGDICFDLNDAELVVNEMVERNEWVKFLCYADDFHYNAETQIEFTAWLFNADNFFSVFVSWLKNK